jgi:hypothetical protein
MYGLDPLTGLCTYSTPCGWCCKWDKKCDKKIGCGNSPSTPTPKSHAQKFIDEIKSGKLPPIDSNSDFGLQNLNETRKSK